MKKKNYNEIGLIRCLSKVNLSHPQKQQILSLINDSIDWEFIYNYSKIHNISNLIYHNINKTNLFEKIPAKIYSKLKKDYDSTSTQNIWLWSQFRRIQQLLKIANIPIIPLKGIIFTDSLYHNLGLREMVDIDILIKESDLTACMDKLIQAGYQNKESISLAYREKYHCHTTFSNPAKTISIELHWAFAPPRPDRIDLTDVWQRAKITEIDGQGILTLSLEDTLLSLCINLCKNIPNLQYLQLKNLCDINELISQYNDKLDWHYILNKVTQWRIKGSFYFLYRLTENLLETPWPEEIVKQIYPPNFQRKILNCHTRELKRRSQISAILLMLLMLGSFADAIRLIIRLTSQALSIFMQNKKLFSLYLKR